MSQRDTKPTQTSSAEELAGDKPIVSVDLEKYLPYLDDPSTSDADKLELLASLRQILRDFVALGFGVHPLQNTCGKDVESDAILSEELLDDVYSTSNQKNETDVKQEADTALAE